MAEFTLSTGKKVVIREMSAYHEFLMARHLEGPMFDPKSQQVAASYWSQLEMLQTAFQIESVNGKAVEVPTDEMKLVLAFSSMTNAEFGELTLKLRKKKGDPAEGNESAAPGSTSVPNS